MREEDIKSQLTARFPFLGEKVLITRARRIFVSPLGKDDFEKIFDYVVKEAGFNNFHMICGLHTGDNLEFVYVLSNEEHIVLNLELTVPIAEPVIKSIVNVFPNALWHEREVVDLLGAIVEDLPEGPHYPLPDGWPEGNYPLRKDWRPEYFDKKTMTYNPPAPQSQEESTAEVADNK